MQHLLRHATLEQVEAKSDALVHTAAALQRNEPGYEVVSVGPTTNFVGDAMTMVGIRHPG